MARRVLLTGVGGFIGAHTLDHLLINTDWDIVGIDSFRHKGLTDRVTESMHWQNNRHRVRIITHDLLAPFSPLTIDNIGPIDDIINMASESHVERSITDPVPFVQNNVWLVLNMLEYARQIKPSTFIQISTDEVYGPMYNNIPHEEWEALVPSNPYSASKAAQEAVAISYWRSYGIPLVITNTMNNFGERQDPEKYLPNVIRKVLKDEEVIVHGTIRDIGSRFWLHARNHADALLWILNNTKPTLFPKGDKPDRYNVVGDRQIDNLEMAMRVAAILKKPLAYKLVDFHSTRPGHDPHYGLDGGKLQSLGWVPPVDFESSLEHTITWTKEHPQWLKL